MSLERACQCGAGYLALSPYDYSCPTCWRAECNAAVRVIEWVGGMAPTGAMAVERTPITDTYEAAIAFVCGPWSDAHYQHSGTIVACLVSRYRKPWTQAIDPELLDTSDIVATHEPLEQLVDARDGRAFAPSGDGWWWLDTEVAWVADPADITCDESDCCLARS